MAVMDETDDIGTFVEFGRLVREVVGGRSLRACQMKTGVSHTTIADMMKGIRPKQGTIRLFAAGFEIDPNPLLRAAGYPVHQSPVIGTRFPERTGRTETDDLADLSPDDDIERIPDQDINYVVHAAEGLSQTDRRKLREYVELLVLANRAQSLGGTGEKKTDQGETKE